MAYIQKEGQGSLFKNDKKESDNHPDYKGSIMIGGVEYWLSAWTKRPEGKKPFFSLSAKPKQPHGDSTRTQPPNLPKEDDQVPF